MNRATLGSSQDQDKTTSKVLSDSFPRQRIRTIARQKGCQQPK